MPSSSIGCYLSFGVIEHFKEGPARVLKEEGFINHYRVSSDHKQGLLKLNLRYSPQKERAIQGVKRVSRPGLRVFRGWEKIPSVQNGLGTAIVSTSKGLMADRSFRWL